MRIAVLIFVLASAFSVAAQGSYTQIDVPGASNTVLSGINTAGEIVGWYQDISGFQHGFILSDSTYTTVDYPGAANTVLFRMNDVGQVVGSTESTPYVAFEYQVASQSFVVVSYPIQGAITYPLAINNGGTIAGFFYNGVGNIAAGFKMAGSAYRQITPPGSSGIEVFGVSDSGLLVGRATFKGKRKRLNFRFDRGVYARVHISGISEEALVLGMNTAGTMLVGLVNLSTGYQSGFCYQPGTAAAQLLSFPGAVNTNAMGVNNAGTVVGYFTDGINSHGFLWTPPADPEKAR